MSAAAMAASALNLGWGRKLPLVLQSEGAECGLACLAMITSYLGSGLDTAELRRRYGLSLRGATLKELMRIADQLGLATRPLRLDLEELPLLKTPCILHWDLNHFVVLKSAGRTGIVVHDPALGIRRLSLAQVSKHFTGVALELAPTGGFEPAAAVPRVGMRALVGRLVGLKRSLSQVLVLALAIEIIAMISPLFLGWVVDHALVSADRDLLLTLALGFLLLLLLRTAISAMRGWVLIVLGASTKVQARNNLFAHLVRLPASYFEARHLGDVMSRFGSQETILQAITTELVVAVLDGLMSVVTLIVMFLFAPMLALVAVIGALLYALLRLAFYLPLRQASGEAIIWGARRDSHFLETMRGIKTIKLFNAHEDRRAHWMNLLVETMNRQLAAQKLQLLFRTANGLLLGVLGILVVWLGARQVLDNAFTVGMLIAFVAYKDQFLTRISDLTDRLVDLHMLRLHTERLADIALTPPEARTDLGSALAGLGERAPEAGRAASIEVRDLSFRYGSTDPWVLDKVNLRIEAGESVAIVGESGCGKTTLLKLLAGLIEPTEGVILIDGEPLPRLGLDRYRAMIGVVMQDDQLFAGSIADNITFFAMRPDPARIARCAQVAAIHDDILAMPMNYGTLIGDMGAVLSGGQKQRLFLARALYRDPKILLLDEATSHLDVRREADVNAALASARMTRVVIAHRPETIRAAERVILVERGRVVEAPGDVSGDVPGDAPDWSPDGARARVGSGAGVLARS